jgi:hypothetical protein
MIFQNTTLVEKIETLCRSAREVGALLPGKIFSKEVMLGSFKVTLVFSEPRQRRADKEFLIQKGIISAHAPRYCTVLEPDGFYVTVIPKEQAGLGPGIRESTLVNFKEITPLNPHTELTLYGENKRPTSFFIAPNFAPLGTNHMVCWIKADSPQTRIRSMAYDRESLWWFDGLLRQLDHRYFLFENSTVGRSEDIKHGQLLMATPPVFERLMSIPTLKQQGISIVTTDEWFLPGILLRYMEEQSVIRKKELFFEFDDLIQKYVRSGKKFNFVARKAEGVSEIFFVMRGDSPVKLSIHGNLSTIAGFESAGFFTTDNFDHFQNPGTISLAQEGDQL